MRIKTQLVRERYEFPDSLGTGVNPLNNIQTVIQIKDFEGTFGQISRLPLHSFSFWPFRAGSNQPSRGLQTRDAIASDSENSNSRRGSSFSHIHDDLGNTSKGAKKILINESYIVQCLFHFYY